MLLGLQVEACDHSLWSISLSPAPWGAFGQPRNLRDPQDLREGVRAASSISGPWSLQVLRVTAHKQGHVPVGGVGPGGEERAPSPRRRQPSGVSPCGDEPQWKGPMHPGPHDPEGRGLPGCKGSCASRQLVRPGWGSFQGRGPHQARGWGGEPPVSRLALLRVSAPLLSCERSPSPPYPPGRLKEAGLPWVCLGLPPAGLQGDRKSVV